MMFKEYRYCLYYMVYILLNKVLKMKWVIIESYSMPYEAQIAKSLLTSQGIPAIIENEHTINMYWFYSNALGGVKVLVPEDYLERAKFIISNDYSADVDEKFSLQKEKCPSCGGLNLLAHTQGRRTAFIFLMLIGLPISRYKHGMKCQDCGYFY